MNLWNASLPANAVSEHCMHVCMYMLHVLEANRQSLAHAGLFSQSAAPQGETRTNETTSCICYTPSKNVCICSANTMLRIMSCFLSSTMITDLE